MHRTQTAHTQVSPATTLGKALEVSVDIANREFAEILKTLLNERSLSISDLYDYLWERGYIIEKSSVYRYFNYKRQTNRLPDESFLRHFAEFAGLSTNEQKGLILFWKVHKKIIRR